jgi:hypothetical protein
MQSALCACGGGGRKSAVMFHLALKNAIIAQSFSAEVLRKMVVEARLAATLVMEGPPTSNDESTVLLG